MGAGAWGTALAAHLARAGHDVRLWARRAEAAAEIAGGTNAVHLPGVALPPLPATTDLAAAVAGAEAVLVAVPSEFGRAAYRALRPVRAAGRGRGLRHQGPRARTSLRRMSEVAAEELPGPARWPCSPGRRSRPRSRPGSRRRWWSPPPTLAVAEVVQRAVSTRTFRAYSSDDVVGVELGGALKNVIAIAAGIVDGLGYGHNTVAALVTRGLAEMTRLAVALGRAPRHPGRARRPRRPRPHLHRAPVPQPRLRPGPGRGACRSSAALGERRTVVEGIRTTAAACDLAARAGIEMPIATQMRAVLYEGKPVRDAVDELMLAEPQKGVDWCPLAPADELAIGPMNP